jgi:hypothetical protein
MKHTHGITLAAMLAFTGMVFLWRRRPKPQ